MRKVVVFGAGEVGAMAKKKMEESGDCVLLFLDNNPKRWGQTFEGLLVCSPQELHHMQYDVIAIGVYKAAESITNQLLEYGVPKEKIEIPVEPVRIFPNSLFDSNEDFEQRQRFLLEMGSKCVEVDRELDYEIDFCNNFWGLIYFLKECEEQGENVKKSYSDACKVPLRSGNLLVKIGVYSRKEEVEERIELLEKNDTDWMYLESEWLSQMFESHESIQFWKRRYSRDFEAELTARLDEVKAEMKKNNVPLEEVCVVGSTVLQLYGILPCKKRDDVDIIMTSKLRDIYGKGLVIVSEHVEIHPQNKMDIDDEEIIQNEEHYFWFRGLKILKLQDFYRNRKESKDAKLVEYFLRG